MPPANSIFKPKAQIPTKMEQHKKEITYSAEDFGRIHIIPTERILPNSNQPRRIFEEDSIIRLADSIRRYGLLQPIALRRSELSGKTDFFEIVAGERRFRAIKLLGMAEIPSIIIKADKQKSAELAIIENIQRENLNIFEQASAIASLIDMYGMTQEAVAARLSTSQSFVANKLRILRLTLAEREKILNSGLSERHARALLKISDIPRRMQVIEHICKHNLTVAATEEYIEKLLLETQNQKKPHPQRKIVLKDMRVFYNSIDRAISIVKQAGIKVETHRVDEEDFTCLTIRIPKGGNVSRETL